MKKIWRLTILISIAIVLAILYWYFYIYNPTDNIAYWPNWQIKHIYHESYWKLNWEWVDYYENGQIYRVMHFNDGQQHWEFITYYENGQIADIHHFDHFELTWESIYYRPTWELKWKWNYVNWLPVDWEYIERYENWDIMRRVTYKNWKIDWYDVWYDRNGDVSFNYDADWNTVYKSEILDKLEFIFSWNLREDADLFYTIKWTPEWSGWKYIIEIKPVDKWWDWDKQPQTISFLSDVKISNVIELSGSELYPEERIVSVPELLLKISWDRIEVDDNFWIYCPGKDLDEFILIPWWEWNLSDETVERDNNQYQWDVYNFMWSVKYINHYKKWDIWMFFEWNEWNWFRIDDSELFSKNCMIEIWEIEDFLPLNLPFELNFNKFDYTTIWFVKELSDNSDCLSSHKISSPHNNYISFFTENMACQLWYESWTTLESIIFENSNFNY